MMTKLNKAQISELQPAPPVPRAQEMAQVCQQLLLLGFKARRSGPGNDLVQVTVDVKSWLSRIGRPLRSVIAHSWDQP
jgi:hypothetical protein